MATAAEITKLLATVDRDVTEAQAKRLEDQLKAAHGDLEGLIDGLMHSSLSALDSGLTIALAYRSALIEQADPMGKAKRLRGQADALDRQSNLFVEDGAMWAGRGDHKRAYAMDTLAAECVAEALVKRTEAAGIERRVRYADAVVAGLSKRAA